MSPQAYAQTLTQLLFPRDKPPSTSIQGLSHIWFYIFTATSPMASFYIINSYLLNEWKVISFIINLFRCPDWILSEKSKCCQNGFIFRVYFFFERRLKATVWYCQHEWKLCRVSQGQSDKAHQHATQPESIWAHHPHPPAAPPLLTLCKGSQ